MPETRLVRHRHFYKYYRVWEWGSIFLAWSLKGSCINGVVMFIYICILYSQARFEPDLAKWLERLTANIEVATVLGSIPASSDTVESEGPQMKQCWIQYNKKCKKISPFLRFEPPILYGLIFSWLPLLYNMLLFSVNQLSFDAVRTGVILEGLFTLSCTQPETWGRWLDRFRWINGYTIRNTVVGRKWFSSKSLQ